MTDDSRALSAQETNVGAPHGAIRARQGEDDAAAVLYGTCAVEPMEEKPFTFKAFITSMLDALLPVPDGGRWHVMEDAHFPADDPDQELTAYMEMEPQPAAFSGIEGSPRIRITSITKANQILAACSRPSSASETEVLQGNAESPESSDLDATGAITRPTPTTSEE